MGPGDAVRRLRELVAVVRAMLSLKSEAGANVYQSYVIYRVYHSDSSAYPV